MEGELGYTLSNTIEYVYSDSNKVILPYLNKDPESDALFLQLAFWWLLLANWLDYYPHAPSRPDDDLVLNWG